MIRIAFLTGAAVLATACPAGAQALYHCVLDGQVAAPDQRVSFEIAIKPDGEFASIIFRAANGTAYDRGKQYDGKNSQDGNGQHYWTGTLGTNPNVAIVGSLSRKGNRLVYSETISDSVLGNVQITSTCKPIVEWPASSLIGSLCRACVRQVQSQSYRTKKCNWPHRRWPSDCSLPNFQPFDHVRYFPKPIGHAGRRPLPVLAMFSHLRYHPRATAMTREPNRLVPPVRPRQPGTATPATSYRRKQTGYAHSPVALALAVLGRADWWNGCLGDSRQRATNHGHMFRMASRPYLYRPKRLPFH
jgi:hypothetical protein